MTFTLKQLQVFVAVVNHGSTSAAARQLKVSQPAVSSTLTELEANIGLALFDRWKKRIKVNDRGRALLPMARLLLANARDLDSMFQNGGMELAGSLRCGASTTLAGYVIPVLISTFASKYPTVKMEVICRNKTGIISMIEDFSLDIGIIAGTCNRPNVENKAWLTDELCVFASVSHPLARLSSLSIADLISSKWVLREEGSGTLEVFLNALPPEAKPLDVIMECDNLVSIKRLVEYGSALSCISYKAIQREVEAGILKVLPTPFLKLSRDYSILVHKQRRQSPVISSFLGHILAL